MTASERWGQLHHRDVIRLSEARVSARAWTLFGLLLCRKPRASSYVRARLDTMAEELGCSKSTIQRALRELVDCGAVSVKRTGRSSMFSFPPPPVDNPVGLRLVGDQSEWST